MGLSRARIGAIVKRLREKGLDLAVVDGRAVANRARHTTDE